jgi:NAD-dependent SIR2 family protein deacetylase
MPYPDALFDADYFKEHPRRVCDLYKSFWWLDRYQSGMAHQFINMLIR